jgi:hypothetical protein
MQSMATLEGLQLALDKLNSRKYRVHKERVFMRDGRVCRYCGSDEEPLHIDHIIPLSRRGTNEIENLQILCKPCHFEKTRQEQNDQYIKQSETESSVNQTTKKIFNSDLTQKYAFVEKLSNIQTDKKKY